MSESSKFNADIVDQFNKTAENYSQDNLFSNGHDLDIMLKQAHPNPSTVALDVATGAGHVAMKIAPFAKKVYAIDITPKMIALLQDSLDYKHIKNVEASVMHADNLEFPDDFFDIVTCRFATHHFTDVSKFLSEVKRVLKSNGKLVLTDIIAPSSKSMSKFVNEINKLRDHTHVRELSESEWESMFQEQNFTVLKKYNNPLTHDLDDWFKRAKTSDDDKKKIIEKFRGEFESQIVFKVDSKIRSFVEDSMIFTVQI